VDVFVQAQITQLHIDIIISMVGEETIIQNLDNIDLFTGNA